MPFTLAHPAAILPLRRFVPALPLGALVAGSMAHDLEYLVRLAQRRDQGHSAVGFLAFDLPMALVVLLAFDRFLMPVFRVHVGLPSKPAFWLFALLLVALALGTLLHLL